MSSNDKLIQASENVQNMEKHFNSAISLMTEALNDKADEIRLVSRERQFYKEMATALSIATFASYCLGYLVAKVVTC